MTVRPAEFATTPVRVAFPTRFSHAPKVHHSSAQPSRLGGLAIDSGGLSGRDTIGPPAQFVRHLILGNRLVELLLVPALRQPTGSTWKNVI